MTNLIEKFLTEINYASQGSVAYANLADFKRRNQYLGYQGGDLEISQFEVIVKSILDNINGKFKRVEGDGWLIYLPDSESISCLQEIIDRFEQFDKAVDVGWTGKAKTNDGIIKEIKESRKEILKRGVRIGYRNLPVKNLSQAVVELMENLYKAEPIHQLHEWSVLNKESASTKWKCINLTAPAFYCPNCGSAKFNWKSGFDNSAEGLCQHCHCEVEFINL